MTDTRVSSGTVEGDRQLAVLDAIHSTEEADIDFLLDMLKSAPDWLARRDAVRSFRKQIALAACLIPGDAQAAPEPRKQAYEVARHVIGYLAGNCGLSYIDVKQADWDAVTRLVATLTLPSTDREGGK